MGVSGWVGVERERKGVKFLIYFLNIKIEDCLWSSWRLCLGTETVKRQRERKERMWEIM